ncbi:MAG: hypothetical protein V1663_00360 [archaeon]
MEEKHHKKEHHQSYEHHEHNMHSEHFDHHKDMIERLIENSILLQKKDAELMSSVNELVKKIDRMLNVFEEASKHVIEVGENKKIIELSEKLESLLEQNKTIAKGLLMLEQYVRNKTNPIL